MYMSLGIQTGAAVGSQSKQVLNIKDQEFKLTVKKPTSQGFPWWRRG